VAVALAALHQLAMTGYYVLWRVPYPFWLFWAVSMSEYTAVLVFGMYLRARRQLVASLRDRVAEAIAAQRVMADQVRLAERTRIATEMHDVLAHRVSLIAMHAGTLEIRPDLPPGEVIQTAGLIRSTARQALTELRDVIGVLREPADDAGAPLAPQPTLGTIAGLVAEYRRAGLNVGLDMHVTRPEVASGPLGRDAYRIVREGLANVTKHATGTAATVTVEGGPGDGLNVTVRNKLPLNYAGPALPGSGLGLVGLAERVALAGGTLSHGPESGGDFVLRAALRWETEE
jgi:signal transduction histidine kinase